MECLIAIGTWIGGKIADYTVGPVGHKLGYIFHCKRNVGNLLTETQDLNLEKKRMEDFVDVARRNGEEIHDHIKDWLSKVGDITKDAEKLLGDDNHTSVKCTFRGSFQNLVQRYHLSRKAKKMGESVSKIKGEIGFDNISYRPRLQSNFRNKDFMNFDTRKEIMARIMEALKDGNIKMIGVYGMSGAGKTTLVKEIAREALDKKLFNDAILITVSQTPNIKNIQQEIAEKLDLKVDKESISERAVLLQNRLKSEEKFLIILDDVWNNEVNFQDLGILVESDDQKGSKILLTSRFERVLHDDMGVEMTFPIELISEDEAWDLFSHIVGDLVRTPDFQQHGNEIVKECACLPIAIVTVAHALKNHALPFWRDALGQLQRSNLNINGMHEKVYSRIKLCYDYLQNEEAKSLLLLCCLHKEDTSKHLEYLMRYGIGLDMFKGVRTMQEAKDRVYSLVDELKDRFLLLGDDDCRSVEMHDVICDVVRSIGKESHMYYFRDGTEVEEIRKRKTLRDARAISLPNGYVDGLICESFEYKQLEIIWMCKNKSLDIIPNSFFEKTKELRVLYFLSQNLEVLPSSLCFLHNLRTLCMHGCQLGDIAFIGELRNLEILDLTESSITELPRQISQLTRLRILDLSECKDLIVIHPNIISQLTCLEGLYMLDFRNWDKNVVVDGEIRNASLLELKHLVQLTGLHLQIPDIRMLPKPLLSEKLESYVFLIHDDEDEEDDDDDFDINVLFSRISPPRFVAISCRHIESIQLQDYGLQTALKRSNMLYLSELQGVNDIIYELDTNGFPELKWFWLKNSDDIRYLVNSMGHLNCSSVFGILETLWLVNLPNLEKICQGELTVESFKRLSVIRVRECKRLKNLLPSSIATRLKEIEITDCEMMKEIVTHEIDDDNVGEVVVDEFHHLCSLELVNVSKLRNFCSKLNKNSHTSQNEEQPLIVDSFTPFFDGKFVSFPKLEKLKLSRCNLTKIWDDQFQPSSTSFRNLTKLGVGSCNFMENLFSSAVAASLEQLYSLNISDCTMMEEIMTRNGSVDEMSFPKLNYLTLENLPNLVSFSSSISIAFPMLVQLYIKNCPGFKTFISSSEEESCTTMISLFNKNATFPSLNKVLIEGMDELKMIWQYELTANSFCKLKDVTVRNCKNLMKIIPSSMQRRLQNVTHLEICDCEMVEKVFDIQITNNIEETDPIIPSQLVHLSLNRLLKLKYVWSTDPQGTLSFPNLENVVASRCPTLESIFPASIAKGVFQLKRLNIRSCGIEVVVAKEEGLGTAPPEFVFPQLVEMELNNLPNLVSFYPGLHISRWLLLTRLDVINCRKVKVFASEFFQEMHQSAHDENIGMQQPLFLTKFSFPKLEKLRLLGFHFEKIWDDPVLLGSTFRHLIELKVDSCEFLRSIFSSAAISASLKQLYSIEIRHCRMVEEIMSRNENLDKISFSKLNNLYLTNLPNLKRFSTNIFVQFPLLTELFILDCPQFETFISNSEDNSCTAIPSLFDQRFVSFPKLEVLELSGCWSKRIWDDQVLPRSSSFCSLTRLIVVNCDMKILFSSVMVKSFAQLCSLVVRDCRMLEETMRGNANMYKMSFPYLNHLKLENLPNLLTFSSSNFIEFPMLTQLSIMDCPKFKTFISNSEENSCTTSMSSLFNEKFVSFPGLENLELYGCNFTKIWDDQLLLSSTSFRKLRKLVVYRCKYLRNLFTCAVAVSLEQLCFLDIRFCAAMEEIMSSNGSMDKILFPMLQSLALKKLPILVTVTSAIFCEFPLLTELCIKDCPGFNSFISESEENSCTSTTMLSPFKEKFVSFPKLEKLELLGCHLKKTWAIQLQQSSTFCNLTKLVVVECEGSKNLFSYGMAASFEQLWFLEIRNCTTVEEIIISKNERMESLSFPKLNSLELENLPNLVTFSSSEIPIEFPLLTELSIHGCPKFETFIPKSESLFNECVSFPILKNLKLSGFHFTKIWDDGQFLSSSTSLCNLKKMCLDNCKFLKKLFSSAMALTFEGLENLEIRDCTLMEEIVSNNEMMDKVSFPKLKFLELENLPILSTFSSAIFVEFPLLTSLHISGCPEFNSFISKQEENFCTSTMQSLFNEMATFPSLEEVLIEGMDKLRTIWQHILAENSFCKLKNVTARKCKNLMKIIPSSTQRRLKNVRFLEIRDCEMVEEVFEIQMSNNIEETYPIIPIELTHLGLYHLARLRYVWSKDPQGTLALPRLREVFASECPNLKSIFPPSIAKGLFRLERLHIGSCGIEEIVAKEEGFGIAQPEFVFPELREIKLKNLVNLVSFYPGLHTSIWEILKRLDVIDCMKVKVFALEFLQETHGSENHDNISIQQPLFFTKVGLSSSMLISQQQLSAYFFCKLEEINVYNCRSLTKMFSCNMLKRLHNLSKLVISNCEMMEEVFDFQISNDDHRETYEIIHIHLRELRLAILPKLKHVWSKDPQGTFSFQDLQRVDVYQCQSMKNLFPPSVAKSLLRLRKLHITNCGIQEIVAMEEGIEAEPSKFVFPQLEVMVLVNLPNLVSFYPGLHSSSWPLLRKIDVLDCIKVKVLMSELFKFQEIQGSTNHVIPFQQPLFLLDKVARPSMMMSSADFFGKLKEINVYNCKSLTKMLSSNILRSVHNLSRLAISKCDMLEEVFEIQMSSNDHQQTSEIPLIHLKELRLGFLPKLKHVWSKDPQGTLTFQDLQVVEAYECQSLKYLFPPSVAKSLLQLRGLYITKCGIEEIVAKEEGSEAAPHKFVFLQLEVMLLINLPNLVCFYPGLHTSTWPSLRKLDVVGCMKVEVFASELFFSFQEAHESTHHDVPNQVQPLFSVEKVELHAPIMVMISQDQLTTDTFGKLKEINVCNCKSLTKMFSSSTLRRLHNLRKLVISNCEMMEEVFEIHEISTEVAVSIHLTELSLSFLPKLKYVWSNDPKGTFAFQDLQMLGVHECQSLKILFPITVAKNLLQLRKLYIGNCGIKQIVAKEEGQNQTIIPSLVFPQLNSLTLHSLPQLMCFYPGLHTLKLPMLRWLQVSYFMKAKEFSLKFLPIKETSGLIHQNFSFEEPLFLIDKVTYPVGDQEECGTLSRLSGLKLYDMPNLMHLRDESSQPQTFFQSLTELDIFRCGRIKKLMPSSMSFQNLITLKVRQCHGMPSLLTSQTAISMARLETLIIWDCKRMAEIIVDEKEGGDDVEGGEIVFARLKTLELDCLPSLTSFFSGKYMLGFPDLENVMVRRCFEMQSFSKHGYMVSTPKLHKLFTEAATNKEIDDINIIMAVSTPLDLNTIIPELWKSHPGTVLQQLFCDKDRSLKFVRQTSRHLKLIV